MKRITFLLGLLSLVLVGSAQTLETIDWGTYQEMPKNTRFKKVIGYDDDGFYLVREDKYNKDNLWLDFVSRLTLTVDESNTITLPTYLGSQTHYFDMFYINKKFILLTYSIDESTNEKKLFIQYLNKDGSLKNRPMLVATLPAGNFPQDDFRVRLDKDNQIYIFFQKSFKEYNEEPFTIIKYNSNLQKTFYQEFSLPKEFIGRKFVVKQTAISNKMKGGKIIMLLRAEAVARRKSRSKKAPTHEIIVETYYPKKKEFHKAVVNLGKYKTTDAIFALNKDGNMVIGGFLEPKTNKIPGSFTGVFYRVYNPDTYKFLPLGGTKGFYKVLSKDMIAQLRTKRNGDTPDLQFAYKLKSIELLDNGSFIILAENQYGTQRSIKDPKTKQERLIRYYHFNDILAAGVNNKGIVSWIKIIPKNQYSIDDGGYYSSYKVLKIRNKIKLIYNDLPSNLKAKSPDKIKELKNNLHLAAPRGNAVITSIFYDGSTVTDLMFPDKEKDNTIVPSLITPLDGQYFTIAIKKKQYKFATFVVE
jgi:hypothetical protein